MIRKEDFQERLEEAARKESERMKPSKEEQAEQEELADRRQEYYNLFSNYQKVLHALDDRKEEKKKMLGVPQWLRRIIDLARERGDWGENVLEYEIRKLDDEDQLRLIVSDREWKSHYEVYSQWGGNDVLVAKGVALDRIAELRRKNGPSMDEIYLGEVVLRGWEDSDVRRHAVAMIGDVNLLHYLRDALISRIEDACRLKYCSHGALGNEDYWAPAILASVHRRIKSVEAQAEQGKAGKDEHPGIDSCDPLAGFLGSSE